jgi:threonine/homoserine/homoserine lactone efflux protein
MLFDISTLLAYCAASIVLVITPGPGQALVIARTLSDGRKAGVLTAIGLEIGTLAHTVAAGLGLSALLAASAMGFSIVKYAGAAYLLVLGVLMLARKQAAASISVDAATGMRILTHGVVTGTLNPKVALFFVAFLPQFVHPERGRVFLQFLCLGLILGTLGLIGDCTVAWLAARASGRLARNAHFAAWRERVTGSILIALGLRLALADRR